MSFHVDLWLVIMRLVQLKAIVALLWQCRWCSTHLTW